MKYVVNFVNCTWQLTEPDQTTAHTLAYAFVLLALYPDEQEAFYQNLKSVLPSDRSPVRLSALSSHGTKAKC